MPLSSGASIAIGISIAVAVFIILFFVFTSGPEIPFVDTQGLAATVVARQRALNVAANSNYRDVYGAASEQRLRAFDNVLSTAGTDAGADVYDSFVKNPF